MPQKNSYITVTDQFCGAGGSSQGAEAAGCEVKLALNHWKLAIETHNTNFPNTLHECTDISACDPRRYPSTDILITSPECTNHSLAKGQKQVKKQLDMFAAGTADAAAERSRATMWDVCRFAEYHTYNVIIVENVVDARSWVLWDAWLQAMYALGYQHKCVYLNSQHAHPTPQSRDRMYVVFWKKGNKAPELDYMPLSYCPKCEKDVQAIQTWKNPQKRFGKYKQQYVYCCPHDGVKVEPYYYAAFNCIDWSNRGTRIGDRKKDLSDNSKKRILHGLEKFGGEEFILQTVNGGEHEHRSRSVSDPLYTQTTLQSQALIINDQHSTGIDCRVKSSGAVLPGVTTAHNLKVLQMPFIIKGEHTKVEPQVKSTTDTIQTQATRQTMSLLTPPPFIVENKGTSTARAITSPFGCVTGAPYHGLLTPAAVNSFIHYNRSQDVTHATQPIQTIATKEQNSIISYDAKPKYEDCYYRMLMPKETKLAMAFNADYVVLGSGKDQVKQLGNAVTPPAMKWLVQQAVNSLL